MFFLIILFVLAVIAMLSMLYLAYDGAISANRRGRISPVPVSGPIDALRDFFVRFFVFRGTSTRSQYVWMWLIGAVTSFLVGLLPSVMVNDVSVIPVVYSLIFIIPSIMLMIRRLHDAGLSGWWFLWMLLLVCAVVVLWTLIGAFDVVTDISAIPNVGFIGYLLPLALVTLPSKYIDNKYRK